MRIRRDKYEIQDDEIELIASVSDALAHPLRVKIVRHIMNCNKERVDVCTKDLVAEFGYAQATISQHMKRLVQSGLIEVRKKEKFNYYYVNVGLLFRYVDIAKKFTIG